METFETKSFPVRLGPRNSFALERIFRSSIDTYPPGKEFPFGKEVDVLQNDGHSLEMDGILGVREVAENIAMNVSMMIFGYTFFERIHRPILIVSRDVTNHSDADKPNEKKDKLVNSISRPNDALSLLVPLKREGAGKNILRVDPYQYDVGWRCPHYQGFIFDQTKLHGIDGEELKLYWSALVHKKYYDKIRLFSEKMDKIMNPI